jgi:anti-sigma B factor antagonist
MTREPNRSADLALVVTHAGGRPLCKVRGEIDMSTASAVRKVLESFVDVGELDVDLDLSDVTFIDSQGIAELVLAHNQGLRITISAASRPVQRVLEISGVGQLIGIAESESAVDD